MKYKSLTSIIALFSKPRNILLFIFFFTLISRIPGIIILETQDEPADDGAYYYNLASNIKQGNGEVTSFKGVWYENWESREGIIDTPSFTAPIFPYILSFVLSINDSLLAIRLFNALISSLSVCIYYQLMKSLFDNEIAFLASILVITNPLYYYLSISLIAEPLFIFFALNILYFAIVRSDSDSLLNISLVGFMSGVLLLTKWMGILLIASIVFRLLFIKRDYFASSIYSFSLMIPIIPWVLKTKASTGLYLPLLSVLEYSPTNFPPLASHTEPWFTFSSITFFFRNFGAFANDLSTLAIFFLLMPFVILGIIRKWKDDKFSIILLYFAAFIIFSLFYNGGMYIDRYFVLLLISLLPLGIMELRTTLNNSTIFPKFSRRNVFLSWIAILALVSTLYCPFFVIDHNNSFYDNNKEKYNWLNENSDDGDVLAATEHRHTYYFTELPTITIPTGVNEEQLFVFFELYEIKFLVLEERSIDRYRENSIILDLYYNNEVGHLQSFDQFDLELVNYEPGSKSDILFYEVKLKD